MLNSINLRKNNKTILFYLLISILFGIYKCYKYNVRAEKKNEELGLLHITNNENCNQLIPSLFHPILLVTNDYSSNKISSIHNKLKINIPFLSENIIEGSLFYFNNGKFLDELNIILAKNGNQDDENCYFGLSFGFPNDTEGLQTDEDNLSFLLKNKGINEPIFSFDKFILNEDSIYTTLYYGESHENFKEVDSIIGSCKNNDEDNFWGCSFKQMIFDNITISLERNDNKLYKIYFSSEKHKVIFPNDLKIKEMFNNYSCVYQNSKKKFTCENYFKGEKYKPIKLISENMNITLELDNFNRYFLKNNDEEVIEIEFVPQNYIILPLIMFKNFHVQFDAKNNLIWFYTKDSSILQVKKEEQKSQIEESSSSSSSLTVFLVILIIILVLALSFGIYYFIKKRRVNVEKNINRFTKFEDEDDFKNMNENKVY